MLPFCEFTNPKMAPVIRPQEIIILPVFPQTPFPEVRKLTKTTPAAIASSKPLSIIRRLASPFRVSDMYMKDMERGLPLSYLSPRVLPNSRRNSRQSLVPIVLVFRLSENKHSVPQNKCGGAFALPT